MKKKIFIIIFIAKKIIFLVLMFFYSGCQNPVPVQKPVEDETNKGFKKSVKNGKYIVEQEKLLINNAMKNTFKSYMFKETGLEFWVENKIGEQEINKMGDKITYTYQVSDLNDSIIYTYEKIGTKILYLEKQNEIRGIEHALKFMKENEESLLLLPSYLAFGGKGDGKLIPPYLPLAIKLKTIKIEKQ